MFKHIEQFIENENEIQFIEKNYLKDYENVPQFSDIVVKFFDYFTKKIDEQLKKKKMKERKGGNETDGDNFSVTESEEYRNLEVILQKHEAENRNYLRVIN